MMILVVLTRIVQVALIGGFLFGCWISWQNYRGKHEYAVRAGGGGCRAYTSNDVVRSSVSITNVQPSSPKHGLYWEAPKAE